MINHKYPRGNLLVKELNLQECDTIEMKFGLNGGQDFYQIHTRLN